MRRWIVLLVSLAAWLLPSLSVWLSLPNYALIVQTFVVFRLLLELGLAYAGWFVAAALNLSVVVTLIVYCLRHPRPPLWLPVPLLVWSYLQALLFYSYVSGLAGGA